MTTGSGLHLGKLSTKSAQDCSDSWFRSKNIRILLLSWVNMYYFKKCSYIPKLIWVYTYIHMGIYRTWYRYMLLFLSCFSHCLIFVVVVVVVWFRCVLNGLPCWHCCIAILFCMPCLGLIVVMVVFNDTFPLLNMFCFLLAVLCMLLEHLYLGVSVVC